MTTWTTPKTWAFEDLLTAADLDTYVRDNLLDLDRRTVPNTLVVSAAQTISSSTYGDLSTSGPAVTVTVGASGMALVVVSARVEITLNDADALMSYAVSGASTVAANDARALRIKAAYGGQASFVHLHTALTAGSNTFTAKYKSETNTLDSTFANREITVVPLGS